PANTEVTDPKPGDCHGNICDSAGMPIEVENSADVPDDKNLCTLDTCELGQPKHSPRIGYNCKDPGGKFCNDQGGWVAGLADKDCAGKVCQDYAGGPAGCADGAKNGSETDIDCGGACPDCATGKGCMANTDCKGDLCTGMVCQPTCTDGAKNNNETD